MTNWFVSGQTSNIFGPQRRLLDIYLLTDRKDTIGLKTANKRMVSIPVSQANQRRSDWFQQSPLWLYTTDSLQRLELHSGSLQQTVAAA